MVGLATRGWCLKFLAVCYVVRIQAVLPNKRLKCEDGGSVLNRTCVSPESSDASLRRKTFTRRLTTRKTATTHVAFVQGINASSPCASTPCLFRGECRELGDGYICKCAQPRGHDPKNRCNYCVHGFFGKNCQERCGGCRKDNTAFMHTRIPDEPQCDPVTGCGDTCDLGFSNPPKCDVMDCLIVLTLGVNAISSQNDPCFPGVCQNGRCVCPVGRKGPLCKDKYVFYERDKCAPDDDTLECNRGTCYIQEGRHVCVCPPGETAQNFIIAGIQRCVKQCVTGSPSCLHGECQGELCRCYHGYWGTYCQVRCHITRYDRDCTGRCAACKYLPCDAVTGYCPHRSCLPGFSGRRCGRRIGNAKNPVVRGSVAFNGPYTSDFSVPDSESAAKIRDAVADLVTYGFAVTTNRSASNIVISAIYPGSVRVHFSAVVEADIAVDSRVFTRHLTTAMRQKGNTLSAPLPGYELIVNSLLITDVLTPSRQETNSKRVQETRYDKDDAILVTVVVVSGGLALTMSAAMFVFWRKYK